MKDKKRKINPTAYRVPIKTCPHSNQMIRNQTIWNLEHYKECSKSEISKRIKQLNKEWDTERILEVSASSLMMFCSMLGLKYSRFWFLITGTVGLSMYQHALTGWCPPVPLIRKIGVRTSEEINLEKTALKILRGDFNNINHTNITDLYNVIVKQ
ncbi:MAG: hypothetical protein K0S18_989 [Anaerocolumna sp.]|nr:hypothetical protein [Anaerocolumna sp.]